MTIFRAAALAVIAAACLSSTAQAETRDRVSMRVHHADLNLTRAEDRAIFDARVRYAANMACAAQGTDWRMRNDAKRCKGEMRADAQMQMAAIAARSPRVVLASVTAAR